MGELDVMSDFVDRRADVEPSRSQMDGTLAGDGVRPCLSGREGADPNRFGGQPTRAGRFLGCPVGRFESEDDISPLMRGDAEGLLEPDVDARCRFSRKCGKLLNNGLR